MSVDSDPLLVHSFLIPSRLSLRTSRVPGVTSRPWVAIDCDNIRPLAGVDGANLLGPAQQVCSVHGPRGGFSVEETGTLVHGFSAGPVRRRDGTARPEKLEDPDLPFAGIRSVQAWLRKAIRCQCLDRRDFCGRAACR